MLPDLTPPTELPDAEPPALEVSAPSQLDTPGARGSADVHVIAAVNSAVDEPPVGKHHWELYESRPAHRYRCRRCDRKAYTRDRLRLDSIPCAGAVLTYSSKINLTLHQALHFELLQAERCLPADVQLHVLRFMQQVNGNILA
eukprot:6475088-Amphidinium_carterae.1